MPGPHQVHLPGAQVVPNLLCQACCQTLSTQQGTAVLTLCNGDQPYCPGPMYSHLLESSNMIGGGGSMALLGISLELVGCSSDTWNTG